MKQILENNLHRPSPSLTRRLGSPVAPGKLKSRKFSSLDEVLDFEWAFRSISWEEEANSGDDTNPQ